MDDLQQHVMTVFGEALDCASPEARAAYLDGACQKSPEMRRRVEKLLAAHEQAGHFLDGPAAPYRPCPTADWPLGEGLGSAVGPYKLLERIGEGGFGVVFMAEQQQPVRRMVALKLIKPGMDSQQVIARFEAERQALALMEHPNIALVLDAGATPSGRPYFVMELVKGISITQYCDQNSLAPRQRLELFVAVCQAVQHAHQKGIIHRDIKPSNVLVTLHDGTPQVKVIDFGIAKATGQQLTEKLLVTNFAQMIGTPMYMSPEQAPLSGLDIDTRTDIYSLGVLLYELLTGTTPFDKDRFREASYDELRRILREEEPPRPSTRLSTLGEEATSISARRQCEPRQLRRMFRGELDWIVMKALEKDRTRRYETASAFAADVQHYLDDEPVSACPPSAWYRLSKSMRRHKAALAATSAVALALLFAGVGGIWVMWDRAERRADLAQRQADTERTVQVALAKAEQLRVRAGELPSRTSKEAEALLGMWAQAEAALGQAEAALSTGPADEGLQLRVSEVKKQLAQGRRQGELRRQQLQRKEKLLEDLDEARLARSTWIGNNFDNAGAAARYAAAFAAHGLDVQLGGAEQLSQQIKAEEPTVREALVVALDDWSNCASLAKSDGSASELRAIAGSADDDPWRQRFRGAAKSKDREALKSLSAEARRLSLPPASLLLLAERLNDALAERDEALALLRWARNRYPSDFWIALELAVLLHRGAEHSQDKEEAIGCYRVALALRPDTFAAWINLGNVLEKQNHLDEAIQACLKAIDINPNNAYGYTNLGNARLAKNQPVEAIAAYKKAIAIDPRHAVAYQNLGIVLQREKQLDEAIAAHGKAIEINPHEARAYFGLGSALRASNRLDEAIVAFRSAIEINPKYAEAHINLGNTLAKKNQIEEAIIAYQRAIDIDPKHSYAYVGLGNALVAKNQLDGAITAFKKALDIDSRQRHAYVGLGDALTAKKQVDEAITAYQKAIAIDPEHASAYVSLGNALMAKNRLDEAIGAYKKAIDIEPLSAMAYYNLGSALQAKKQPDDAFAAYRKAIEIDPNHAWAHTNLGNILRTKNQPDEAITHYRKALEIDPKNAQTYLNLGGALQSKNQLDDAIAAYRKAIDINPRYAQAHHNLGVALRANNQVDEAIASYRKAIDLNPKYALAYFNLGNALQSKNRHDEAIVAYRQSIAADPKYGPAHYNLGNALRTKNLQDEAIVAYCQAIEINPKHMQAYNGLGLALADTKQFDAAITAFREAVKLDPKAGQTHFNLGKAVIQTGKLAEAKALTEKALELLPDKHSLRSEALKQLQRCDHLLAVQSRLSDLLGGQVKVADNRERLDLIEVCRFQGRYLAASRLWAEAFADDEKLANNLKTAYRFDAACCAVLAAAGAGMEAGQLDDAERTKLRHQALAWLTADIDLWSQSLQGGGIEDRRAVEDKLQHWLRDPDLVSLRSSEAIDTLEAMERDQWRTLWVQVAELHKKAGNPK